MDVMDFALTATQQTAVKDAGGHALERLAPRYQYQAREKEEAIEREVRLEMLPGGPLMPGHGETNGRRPTIRDVAERAGVSKSLVSLVMRGEPMVREEKRRRVHQAANELGYRTNMRRVHCPMSGRGQSVCWSPICGARCWSTWSSGPVRCSRTRV
jgi:hypothetical protein